MFKCRIIRGYFSVISSERARGIFVVGEVAFCSLRREHFYVNYQIEFYLFERVLYIQVQYQRLLLSKFTFLVLFVLLPVSLVRSWTFRSLTFRSRTFRAPLLAISLLAISLPPLAALAISLPALAAAARSCTHLLHQSKPTLSTYAPRLPGSHTL